MIAFDYEAQKWVEGAEGRGERCRQIHEELALLNSPKGQKYAAFLGCSIAQQQSVLLQELHDMEVRSV